MRVLAVVPFFPMPQNHGDAVRRLLLLTALLQDDDLVVLALERDDTVAADRAALRERLPGAEIHTFPFPSAGRSGPSGQLRRSVGGIAGRLPPWVVGQVSAPLRRAARAHARAADLVVLVGEGAGAYADVLGGTPYVWDKSNVLTASELEASRTGPLRGRMRAAATLPLARSFERRVTRGAAAVWVTSDAEAGRVRRHLGDVPLSIVPSAVELPATFAERNRARPYTGGPVDAVWMSSLQYEPNRSGLELLLAACERRLAAGDLRLTVVGAGGEAAQVRRLRATPGVDYLGFVDDLGPVLTAAHCAVVPVWAGAGIKMKTLTLLSHGVPIVATPVAMEGIPLEAAAYVAKRPADFPAILAGLDARRLDESVQLAARRVREEFSPTALADAVSRALVALRGRVPGTAS